jgi:hypothetical protein
MANARENAVSLALDELKPEKLFREATQIQQSGAHLRSPIPSIPPSLASADEIPYEKKFQIYSDMVRNPFSLVKEGKIPVSLKETQLSDEKKHTIATDIATNVYAESISHDQALLLAMMHAHLKLEVAYYDGAGEQSKQSFTVALVAAALALLAFLGAILALLLNGSASSNVATISGIGGALAALVSGVNFYLYGMTSTQFAAFHARLDRIQRFSMAEIMCELLGTEKATQESARDKALAAVITNLASASLADSPTYINPLSPPSAPKQNGQGGQSGNSHGGQSGNSQGKQTGTEDKKRTQSGHSPMGKPPE